MSILLKKRFNALFLINLVYFVNCLYLDLNDGDRCAWGNVTGKCIDFRRCTTYDIDLKHDRTPPICSNNGKTPTICCTACEVLNITYAIKLHDENTETDAREQGRTGVKHYDKCVQYFQKYKYRCKSHTGILWFTAFRPEQGCHGSLYIAAPAPAGGKEAERSEFPHMALLGYGKDLESAQWLCGGSLLSERFILTAAHCKSDPLAGPVKYVGLGMLKRSDPVSLWDRYRLNRFVQHPGYRAPSKYHDIALIETDREIKFKESVLPACIAGDEDIKVHNYLVKSEDTASATGWGASGHRSQTANVLQKVELQRFDELECAVQYPPKRNLRAGYNHSTQMCYGDRDKPRDTCGGNSGGPLQIRSKHSYCLFVVLGVTSYGWACGFAGSAGIYTRVRDYVPWIEDIVWPDI